MATVKDIIREYVGDPNARSAMETIWLITTDMISGPSSASSVANSVAAFMTELPDNPFWQKFGPAVIPQVSTIAIMAVEYHKMSDSKPAAAAVLRSVMASVALACIVSLFSECNTKKSLPEFITRLMAEVGS